MEQVRKETLGRRKPEQMELRPPLPICAVCVGAGPCPLPQVPLEKSGVRRRKRGRRSPVGTAEEGEGALSPGTPQAEAEACPPPRRLPTHRSALPAPDDRARPALHVRPSRRPARGGEAGVRRDCAGHTNPGPAPHPPRTPPGLATAPTCRHRRSRPQCQAHPGPASHRSPPAPRSRLPGPGRAGSGRSPAPLLHCRRRPDTPGATGPDGPGRAGRPDPTPPSWGSRAALQTRARGGPALTSPQGFGVPGWASPPPPSPLQARTPAGAETP